MIDDIFVVECFNKHENNPIFWWLQFSFKFSLITFKWPKKQSDYFFDVMIVIKGTRISTKRSLSTRIHPKVSLFDDLMLPTAMTLPKTSSPTQALTMTLYSPVGKIAKIDLVALSVAFLTFKPWKKIKI